MPRLPQLASQPLISKLHFKVESTEAGKVFAKLAKAENGEKREATRLESCKYFRRSFDIWNEMRQAGTLSKINLHRPDEVGREIAAQCSGI